MTTPTAPTSRAVRLSTAFDELAKIKYSLYQGQTPLSHQFFEPFMISGYRGYFLSYADAVSYFNIIGFDDRLSFECLAKAFGGVPVSNLALASAKHTVRSGEFASSYYRNRSVSDSFFNKSMSFVIKFLDNKSNSHLIRLDSDICDKDIIIRPNAKNQTPYSRFEKISADLITALQDGILPAWFLGHDKEFIRVPIGYWFSDDKKMRWKEGKIFYKDRFGQCFLDHEAFEVFLLQIKDSLDPNSSKKTLRTTTLINDDRELRQAEITQSDFEAIKDSLAFRALKLSLIMEHNQQRNLTTEEIARQIRHTHTYSWLFDQYVEPSNETAITLAKMIKPVSTRKGGRVRKSISRKT